MMIEEALKLTVYLGERDRVGNRGDGPLLVSALIDIYERHGVRTSVLVRGVEGFGLKHRLASEQLLSLSEDLPIMAFAVDAPPLILKLLEEVRSVCRGGLITLERALLLDGPDVPQELSLSTGAVKLTLFLGRHDRVAGRPAHHAAVDCLHRHGLAGASVLLGLDGTVHGARRRARFLARNAAVPLIVQSVGDPRRLARAVPELLAMVARPTITLERVRVCKRDGIVLGDPHENPPADPTGLEHWQKLVVYSGEHARHGQQPLYSALVRRLRLEGAAGATAVRGQWGYHGDHRPHGERFWSLSRQVPTLTTVIDTPANATRWFTIIDEMTAHSGLVTSELVPAVRAAAAPVEQGGLRLADPLDQTPS